jgi:hypothetical protein
MQGDASAGPVERLRPPRRRAESTRTEQVGVSKACGRRTHSLRVVVIRVTQADGNHAFPSAGTRGHPQA